jgi:hypothetical protein
MEKRSKMKLSLDLQKKIDYTKPNPNAIYVRPNGIDAPWELIDGVDFEAMDFFESRERAITSAVDQARKGRFTVYEADSNDVIVGVYFVQTP